MVDVAVVFAMALAIAVMAWVIGGLGRAFDKMALEVAGLRRDLARDRPTLPGSQRSLYEVAPDRPERSGTTRLMAPPQGVGGLGPNGRVS